MGSSVKKTKSLSFIFFKYIVGILFADIVIAVCAVVLLLYVFSYNLVYPANYEETQANLAATTILNADTVTSDMIPDVCEYVIFDSLGNVKEGNLTPEQTRAAWFSIESKQSYYSYKGNYYLQINRVDEYVVLQYQMEPQFVSESLREAIPHPQSIFILVLIIILIFVTLVSSLRFGSSMKKHLSSIVKATQKIQNQDLDFDIEYGSIKEINNVLGAMDKMKSELKSSLQTQWENEDRKKKQISSLAHDLKTPLTIIKGNTELLCDMDPTTNQQECLDYINECTEKMSGYIRRLIDLNNSKFSCVPTFENIDFSFFLEEIKKQAESLCQTKGIHLVFENTLSTKMIYGDLDLLSRAYLNIISNAVEYSPENSELSIYICEDEQYIEVKVRDHGPGFSNEGLKYAATQFYMDDSSRTGGNHFGIGLYEALEVAKLHHGSLILSNAEDGGAVVSMRIEILPVKRDSVLN